VEYIFWYLRKISFWEPRGKARKGEKVGGGGGRYISIIRKKREAKVFRGEEGVRRGKIRSGPKKWSKMKRVKNG